MEHLLVTDLNLLLSYCVCVSASGSSVVLCWWQLGFDLRVKWPLWSRRPAAPACHRGHQWDRQLQHWGNPTNGNTIERWTSSVLLCKTLFFCSTFLPLKTWKVTGYWFLLLSSAAALSFMFCLWNVFRRQLVWCIIMLETNLRVVLQTWLRPIMLIKR